MSLATLIPLQRLCALATVSRAGFYRWRHTPPAQDAGIDLRDQIQRIALEWPCYGWRRVTAELRRRGWTVNHKRVRRIMRQAGSPLGAAVLAPQEVRGDHRLQA